MYGNERHRALAGKMAFISLDEDGKAVYWSPPRSGEWDKDCETGRNSAVALTEYLHKSHDIHIMMPIMSAIGAAGMSEAGVEVGFFSALSELCVRGLDA